MYEYSEFRCEECDGEGRIECSECGQECECAECKGSGLDPIQVDVDGYMAAVRKLEDQARDAGEIVLGWGWYEGKTRVGTICGEYGKVAIADFLT